MTTRGLKKGFDVWRIVKIGDVETVLYYALSTQRDQLYQELCQERGERCEVCGSRAGGNVRQERLNIDHNHQTGMVRGLLCHTCNTGMGMFRDSWKRLVIAAKYLMRASSLEGEDVGGGDFFSKKSANLPMPLITTVSESDDVSREQAISRECASVGTGF